MAAKKCSKCGVEKPLDQFYKHSGCRDGLQPCCKACHYVACRARFDPVRHKQYVKRYREKNPTKDREYYEKNKAILIPRMVEYNRKNREAYLAKMREWRKANPEKVQVWVRNRRAKLKGLVGSHSIEDINDLLKVQNGRCVYCACDIRGAFQVDHIIPVSRGGRNDKANLQLLCKACNLDKRDKDPVEYSKTRAIREKENGRRSSEPQNLVSD